MNRLTLKIAAVSMVALLAATSADARIKSSRKQRNKDLSTNPLANVNSQQPDKVLFDKAMVALKKGRFDVARLDLQTMLNTYPDSEYRMRAKLAVGDSWFKEGGTAALTQAEAEYKDFITFFPQAPEAAEAQMKVADIYYEQMEKPDRDYMNSQRAEQEYRNMLNQFPDSSLIPKAKQRLREVQEVMAERETIIGSYYITRENYGAAIARLRTVVDTFPLYSKSDLALLSIGDAYTGMARMVQANTGVPAAVRERMAAVYNDRAAEAYARVITRYPMAPRVEDAKDRLVAMNRPVPEPTSAALAENEAEEQSRQGLRFTDTLFGLIKHGPTVVSAVHVGEPSLDDPKRTLAPDITKEHLALYNSLVNPGGATEAVASPTAANEPPRSDAPSAAPVQMADPGTGSSVGLSIVSAPNADAVVKPVGPKNTALPAIDKAEAPPEQVNDIKAGSVQTVTPANTAANGKKVKTPKADLDEESSSKRKKKKGLSKINPF